MLKSAINQLGLQVPTASLTHQDGSDAIDHIAIPASWDVISAEAISAAIGLRGRISDHDAYVVEVRA